MYKRIVLTLIPLLIIASIAFSGVTFAVEKQLNIGIIGPQGLPHWSPGGMWDAAQMARDEINAAGGITIGGDTYKINLLSENEYSYPTIDQAAAIGAITNLIGSGAKLIIGGFRTEVTVPMLTVVRSAKVPFFINGAATTWLVNLTTPAQYASDKYIFRVMPTNDSVLLPVIVNYLRYYLLSEKLVKMYGQDLDNNASTPNQVRIAVITEQLSWADSMHRVFTTLYGMPTLPSPPYPPGIPNPYYLGPYANVSYAGRIDPYTVTDTRPWLDAAEAAKCRLMIIIFSAPVGETLIKQWAEGQYHMLPVGINVMSQLQTHWLTCPGCEYEVTMSTSGTRTTFVPGLTEVFWDNFVGNFTAWPIYTAFGAYNGLYTIKAALESVNATDIAAVKDYLDGVGGATADVLIPYIEQTKLQVTTGKFQFTSSPNGPGTGHDIYAIELNLTSALGYPRGLMVQWINGSKMSPKVPAGVLEVVSPRDQQWSRKTRIPPWMYELADVDLDFNGKVGLTDIFVIARSFGTSAGDARWNLEADVDYNLKINLNDIFLIARNFGRSVPQWPIP